MMSTKPLAKKQLKALFIGNSFTARNDVPGLIARLAESRGRTFISQSIIAGGASLRAHWNAGQAQIVVRNGRFDYVILQEQSTLPVKNAKRMHENVRLFHDVIRDAGSQTVLYMTWARQHSPETQQAITDAYTSIGKELGAIVVPVGTAWQKLLSSNDQPVLFDKDGSHPSLAGSYLAACVFYASLFGENLADFNFEVPGLDASTEAKIQKAAGQSSKTVSKTTRTKK
jgi:hypothetical protein